MSLFDPHKIYQKYHLLLMGAVILYSALIGLLSFVFSPKILIRSWYVLFGIAIAFVTVSPQLGVRNSKFPDLKGFQLISSIRFQASVFLLSFTCILTIGYGLITTILCVVVLSISTAAEFRSDGFSYRLVVPTLLIGTIILLRKSISTYLYFGDRDILVHINILNRLISTGQIKSIDHLYQMFPGYHIEISTIGLVTSLGAYDSLVILGVISSQILIFTMFALSNRLFRRPKAALSIAYLTSTSWSMLYFGSYFIPQSFATVLTVIFLLISSIQTKDASKPDRRLSIILLLLLSVLTFSHHLTFILFLVPFAIMIGSMRLMPSGSTSKFNLFHLIFLCLFPISYWSLSGVFIPEIVRASVRQIQLTTSLISPGESAASTVYTFGQIPPSSGLVSIITPQLLLAGTLFGLLIIGIHFTLTSDGQGGIPFAATAILGIPILFPTPLGISVRLGYPWIFFLLVVTGLGLYHTTTLAPKYLLLFILIVGVISPIAVADDVNMSTHNRDEQVSFSIDESTKLQHTGNFMKDMINDEISTFRLSDKALTTIYGVDPTTTSSTPSISSAGISTENKYIVYRSKWTKHVVAPTPRKSKAEPAISIEDRWLSHRISNENHIYNNGGGGIVWNRSGVWMPE